MKKIIKETEHDIHYQLTSSKENERYETDNEHQIRILENINDDVNFFKNDLLDKLDELLEENHKKLTVIESIYNLLKSFCLFIMVLIAIYFFKSF